MLVVTLYVWPYTWYSETSLRTRARACCVCVCVCSVCVFCVCARVCVQHVYVCCVCVLLVCVLCCVFCARVCCVCSACVCMCARSACVCVCVLRVCVCCVCVLRVCVCVCVCVCRVVSSIYNSEQFNLNCIYLVFFRISLSLRSPNVRLVTDFQNFTSAAPNSSSCCTGALVPPCSLVIPTMFLYHVFWIHTEMCHTHTHTVYTETPVAYYTTLYY